MIRRIYMATFLCLLTASSGLASEATFLRAIEGSYAGRGTVKLRTNLKPINVRCEFRSAASASSLSLQGSCTGLLVVSRRISADLSVAGARYKGTYVGAGTGPAALIGKRRNNSLVLKVRSAKSVNGDRDATLTVKKIGARGLTLTTVDRDPKTGKPVVTSEIVLTRQ